MRFRDVTAQRGPCQAEVEFLTDFCVAQGLPLLPLQEIRSFLETTQRISSGFYYSAEKKVLVMNGRTLEDFLGFLH